MTQSSRIKFNPVTREVEIEGSEAFVKKYFGIVQNMLGGVPPAPEKKAAAGEKAAPKKRGRRKAAAPKAPKTSKAAKASKKPGPKKLSMTGKIIDIVQKSPQGISADAIMKKTKASKSLVWNMLSKAKKSGTVRSLGRGVYGPA